MKTKTIIFILIIFCITINAVAEGPNRFGTTTASFLEIGIGSRAAGMGEAYVTSTGDLSSQYWNPAGLAFMQSSEVMMAYQPWIAGIDLSYAGAGLVLPNIGTFAFGLVNFDYGKEDVTTLSMQEGTGEQYSASEYCFSISYARKLAQWFSFGGSGKMVVSNIWHMTGYAAVVDLGVIVDTKFFSVTGKREDGLKIGMSISNYGSSMKYGGIDVLTTVDQNENENGNYEYIPAEYKLESWELPLIFRVGVSLTPLKTRLHQIKVNVDALHPNNNSESVNLGAEYKINVPGTGSFALRCGYKALYLINSEFGPTFGAGLELHMFRNSKMFIDYAYKSVGVFDNFSNYSIGFAF